MRLKTSVSFYYIYFFFNNFDFYRNLYKSLIKIYLIFVFFFFSERMRRINVFSIIFESYNNNLNDVLNTLSSLRNIDKGIIFDLSQSTRVYIFLLCIIENML